VGEHLEEERVQRDAHAGLQHGSVHADGPPGAAVSMRAAGSTAEYFSGTSYFLQRLSRDVDNLHGKFELSRIPSVPEEQDHHGSQNPILYSSYSPTTRA
jgi:hypothetical protein